VLHQQVCPPYRFGYSVPPSALKNDPHRLGKGDAIPGGNKDRFDIGPGAEYHANGPSLVQEGRRIPSFSPHRGMGSHQATLGTADGGDSREDAKMAGQPHFPRMCQSLAVTHQDIRHSLKSGEGLEEQRNFPEAEEAGNIGKPNNPLDPSCFNGFELGEREEDYSCPAIPVSKGTGNICACYIPDGGWETIKDQFRAEGLLDGNGFPVGDVPGVGMEEIHFL